SQLLQYLKTLEHQYPRNAPPLPLGPFNFNLSVDNGKVGAQIELNIRGQFKVNILEPSGMQQQHPQQDQQFEAFGNYLDYSQFDRNQQQDGDAYKIPR